MRKRIIKSERKGMNDREYTRHAMGEAGAYGRAVEFWVRDNDAAKAGRYARLAARWGLKVIGRF